MEVDRDIIVQSFFLPSSRTGLFSVEYHRLQKENMVAPVRDDELRHREQDHIAEAAHASSAEAARGAGHGGSAEAAQGAGHGSSAEAAQGAGHRLRRRARRRHREQDIAQEQLQGLSFPAELQYPSPTAEARVFRQQAIFARRMAAVQRAAAATACLEGRWLDRNTAGERRTGVALPTSTRLRPRRRRVLLVGEGDFAFCLAYLRVASRRAAPAKPEDTVFRWVARGLGYDPAVVFRDDVLDDHVEEDVHHGPLGEDALLREQFSATLRDVPDLADLELVATTVESREEVLATVGGSVCVRAIERDYGAVCRLVFGIDATVLGQEYEELFERTGISGEESETSSCTSADETSEDRHSSCSGQEIMQRPNDSTITDCMIPVSKLGPDAGAPVLSSPEEEDPEQRRRTTSAAQDMSNNDEQRLFDEVIFNFPCLKGSRGTSYRKGDWKSRTKQLVGGFLRAAGSVLTPGGVCRLNLYRGGSDADRASWERIYGLDLSTGRPTLLPAAETEAPLWSKEKRLSSGWIAAFIPYGYAFCMSVGLSSGRSCLSRGMYHLWSSPAENTVSVCFYAK